MEMEVDFDVIPFGGGNDIYEDIKLALRIGKQKLIEAYTEVLDYDVEAIHGSIEAWFGFGSESSYEMPCTTFFGYAGSIFVVLIRKYN